MVAGGTKPTTYLRLARRSAGKEGFSRYRSPRFAGEEQAAVGGHRRLAAGGVVGQDGHHVAADGAELVIVVDPAGAVQLAQAVERPGDLVLGVDHVAAGAQGLGFGDLAAGAD